MVNKLATHPQSIFQAKRRLGPDGLLFERAMEALQFAVALRVMGRGQHMAGLPGADELLEVARATNWLPRSDSPESPTILKTCGRFRRRICGRCRLRATPRRRFALLAGRRRFFRP